MGEWGYDLVDSWDVCRIQYDEDLVVEALVWDFGVGEISVTRSVEEKEKKTRQIITYILPQRELVFETEHDWDDDAKQKRGGEVKKERKEITLTEELAANYPLSSLWAPAKTIFAANVTEHTCAQFAR
ncbi:hypothetical protein FOZ62_007218 [Perkinsus olseni]|nr:hypothetical protein FOZ62_007218 [Perkinsus olseni]